MLFRGQETSHLQKSQPLPLDIRRWYFQDSVSYYASQAALISEVVVLVKRKKMIFRLTYEEN